MDIPTRRARSTRITRTLEAALKSGKISHAYLLTGPRGVGKTSVARILAHEINGLPYTDDQTIHLDIIEIDAASNRRIDEIRDLRDKIHIAPTSAKYKVYIIDEVHMLTKEAFNALLKTLEEPPAHVVFILATTDLQKVPDTIVSRTQRFVFKPIEKHASTAHLEHIAHEENIKITKSALELIAHHAAGGFRDAISLLDQVRHQPGVINETAVAEVLGLIPHDAALRLWTTVMSGDKDAGLKQLKSMQDDGLDDALIAKSLTTFAIDSGNAGLARMFLAASTSKESKIELLLAVLESTLLQSKPLKQPDTNSTIVAEPVTQKLDNPGRGPVVADSTPKLIEPKQKKQSIVTSKDQKETVQHIEKESVDAQIAYSKTVNTTKQPDFWTGVLEKLKVSEPAVYAPLRLASAEATGDKLVIRLDFPFHIKRLMEPTNLEILRTTVAEVTKQSYEITLEKSRQPEKKAEQTPAKARTEPVRESPPSNTKSPLDVVQNIFGNAELM